MNQTITARFGPTMVSRSPSSPVVGAHVETQSALSPQRRVQLAASEGVFDFSSLAPPPLEAPKTNTAAVQVPAIVLADEPPHARETPVERSMSATTDDAIVLERRVIEEPRRTSRSSLPLLAASVLAIGTAAIIALHLSDDLEASRLPSMAAAPSPSHMPMKPQDRSNFREVTIPSDDASEPTELLGRSPHSVVQAANEVPFERPTELGSVLPKAAAVVRPTDQTAKSLPLRTLDEVFSGMRADVPVTASEMTDSPAQEKSLTESKKDAAANRKLDLFVITPEEFTNVVASFPQDALRSTVLHASSSAGTDTPPTELQHTDSPAGLSAQTPVNNTLMMLAVDDQVIRMPVLTPIYTTAETHAMRERAAALLIRNDVAAARLFLKRAADLGDKEAGDQLSAISKR